MATGRVWVSAGGVATELVGVTPPSEKILEIYMQLCAYKVHIEKNVVIFSLSLCILVAKGLLHLPALLSMPLLCVCSPHCCF